MGIAQEGIAGQGMWWHEQRSTDDAQRAGEPAPSSLGINGNAKLLA